MIQRFKYALQKNFKYSRKFRIGHTTTFTHESFYEEAKKAET
jgi:hypothetical protein